jgi:hypothetical protein
MACQHSNNTILSYVASPASHVKQDEAQAGEQLTCQDLLLFVWQQHKYGSAYMAL